MWEQTFLDLVDHPIGRRLVTHHHDDHLADGAQLELQGVHGL
ncbi:MAG: hypothetical protein ACRDPG_05540 [Nocardioidaceae bacterium]